MENSKPIKITVVIPVYGSEKILRELVGQIDKVLKVYSYEIIFVCDHSPDNSWEIIKDLSKNFPAICALRLRTNVGQHNALMAGLNFAKGEIIITMDDDLQHSPKDILSLVLQIEQGYDVVYARFTTRKHALWKIMGSRLNNALASFLINKSTELYLSPFRAMRLSICKDILNYKGPYVYLDGLILLYTDNITSIDVGHQERYAIGDYYGLRKSISLSLKMATSFSIAPLRLTLLAGILISFIGFILAVLLIIQKFTINGMPSGWSSLMVTMLLMNGFQLLALGVIGEYLGRALLTINSKPQYVISERIGMEEN